MKVEVVLRVVGQPVVVICDISVNSALVSVVYDIWDVLHRTRTQGCVEVRCEDTVYQFWAHNPFDLDSFSSVEDRVRGVHHG